MLYKHLTIDEDDLMTENATHYTLQEWNQPDESSGEQMRCLFQPPQWELKNLENVFKKRGKFTSPVSLLQ
jgi:uncharacterized protein YfdQ (DUF2303 family)